MMKIYKLVGVCSVLSTRVSFRCLPLIVLIFLVAAAVPSLSRADILTLKDGQVITGTFKGKASGNYMFETSGTIMEFEADMVQSLDLGDQTPTTETQPALEVQPSTAAQPPTGTAIAQDAVTVPAGTVILVKMQSVFVTGQAKKGDSFTAILEKSVTVDGRTVFSRGAKVHGQVIVAVDVGNISGRPAIGIHLVEVETESGTVPIRTLSHGFIGTTQGTVNDMVAGKVVGQAGPGVVVDSNGRVVIQTGALVEFSLVDPVVVE
jgi:hypothetical protein